MTATGSSCCQTAGSWSFVRLAMIRLMLRRLKGDPLTRNRNFPEPLLQLTKGLLKEGIFIFTMLKHAVQCNGRCLYEAAR